MGIPLSDYMAELVKAFPKMPDYSAELAKAFPKMQDISAELTKAFPKMPDYSAELAKSFPKMQDISTELAKRFPKMPDYSAELAKSFPRLQDISAELAKSFPKMEDYSAELTKAFPKMRGISAELAEAFPKLPNYSAELAKAFAHIPKLSDYFDSNIVAAFKPIEALSRHAREIENAFSTQDEDVSPNGTTVQSDLDAIQAVFDSPSFEQAAPEVRVGMLAELLGKVKTYVTKAFLVGLLINMVINVASNGVYEWLRRQPTPAALDAPNPLHSKATKLDGLWIVRYAVIARNEASRKGAIIAELPEGRGVRVTYWTRQWSEIEWKDPTTKAAGKGWVLTRSLERPDPAIEPL